MEPLSLRMAVDAAVYYDSVVDPTTEEFILLDQWMVVTISVVTIPDMRRLVSLHTA